MSVLFTNVTALLMDEGFTTFTDGYVAVEGANISYVGKDRPLGSFDEVIDCTGKVMMPGFVNAHSHIPMTLMRGYGGGHDLHTWLHQFIFPAEAKLDNRAVAAGTRLGLAEMIASGVTCIADMYAPASVEPHVIGTAVLEAGISADLCAGSVYFGAPEDFTPDKCNDCKVQLKLTELFHNINDGQIRVDASIHAEYTSNPPLWQWMAEYAQRNDQIMHVHVSETRSEHADAIARHGKTPMQTLAQYGVWDNGGIAAHCVYTTAEDWELMAEKHVTAVHNPYSNLKLGSGIAPIPAMLKAGVNVALGTDGMSSHNSADMFEDMKLSAILHNGTACDPMAMTARQALYMATANGAKALRRKTGRITEGYTADLILLDFEAPNLVPCHDVAENLVFAAHGSNVVMNMARGKIIYRNGTFLTLDLERIKDEVRTYALPLIFR